MPLHCKWSSRCLLHPETSETVIPETPSCLRRSFTSPISSARIIASTFFNRLLVILFSFQSIQLIVATIKLLAGKLPLPLIQICQCHICFCYSPSSSAYPRQ